jgi:hypothetical protein
MNTAAWVSGPAIRRPECRHAAFSVLPPGAGRILKDARKSCSSGACGLQRIDTLLRLHAASALQPRLWIVGDGPARAVLGTGWQVTCW